MAPAPVQSCVQCGKSISPETPTDICPDCYEALLSPVHNTELTEAGEEQPGAPITTLFEQLVAELPDREPIRPLGAGGMGQVYLLRHQILERSEALKILQSQIASSSRSRRRFLRESKVLAQLRHPNIVSIFDCTEVGGYLCVLMEYVDGGTLRDLLKSDELSLSRRIAILTQVAEAMGYAHEQGVIHRDIKPENILLTNEGEVKVADFGIGKILDEENSAAELSTRGAIGTPGYMAPEQRETPGLVDRRCDVFSLGVLAYEVLTGKMPHGAFAAPSTIVGVSREVDNVIQTALSNDIEGRYHDGATFLTAWTKATAGSSEWDSAGRLRWSVLRRQTTSLFVRQKWVLAGLLLMAGIWQLQQGFDRSTSRTDSNHATNSPAKGTLFADVESLQEGQAFELPGLRIKLNWVPPGSFEFGQDNEDEWESIPSLPVNITDGFWMAQHELTQGQFLGLMGFNPSHFNRDYFVEKPSKKPSEDDWSNRPVEGLSWRMAHDFCETLTHQAQAHGAIPPDYCFRLPSEIEWEYVSRNGGKRVFLPGSDQAVIIAQAVVANDFAGTPETKVVGSKEPNEWGFYDMLGNVSEFCLDRYWNYADFDGQSLTNWISNEACGIDRMIRGGHYQDDIGVVTSTLRGGTCISDTEEAAGIRLVLSKNSAEIATVRAAVEPKPIEIELLQATFHWITPGPFTMGEPTTESPRGPSVYPPTDVRISPGYWIGDTEVTEFQYRSVMQGATDLTTALDASSESSTNTALPVSNVTWGEAAAFCDRLTKLLRSLEDLPAGYVARLPTEAEWEWACRRCANGIYHWGPRPGPVFGSKVLYSLNSNGSVGPVKGKWSAPGCIFGMYGNVKEWCLDWKYEYSGKWVVNPIGAERPEEELKCIRGGDFLSPAELCTGTARTFLPFDSKSPRVGFRVVIGSATPLSRLVQPRAKL